MSATTAFYTDQNDVGLTRSAQSINWYFTSSSIIIANDGEGTVYWSYLLPKVQGGLLPGEQFKTDKALTEMWIWSSDDSAKYRLFVS